MCGFTPREFPAGFCLVVDRREQAPLRMPLGLPWKVATLPAGDYSLEGFETRVAIERKGLLGATFCVVCAHFSRLNFLSFRIGPSGLFPVPKTTIRIRPDLSHYFRISLSSFHRPPVGSYFYRMPLFYSGPREQKSTALSLRSRSEIQEIRRTGFCLPTWMISKALVTGSR